MSAIKISRDTINKLTHKSIEIRIRTLEQLSSKVSRALELDGTIDFKPGDLCKQLIRWFGFAPLQQPLKVLNLLKSLIESSKYGSTVIDKLGSERLIKELRKIQALFDNQSVEFNVVKKMKEFLETASALKENEVCMKPEDLENLVQCASVMKIDGYPSEYNSEDYETAWSKPSQSDFTSMKLLSDILINKFASNSDVENVIRHLQLTMGDYPAEYLLQSPHIFRNLLQIYDGRKNHQKGHFCVDITATALKQFLFMLEKRLKLLRKSISFNQQCRDRNSARNGSEIPCQLKIGKALTDLFDASVYHLEQNMPYGTSSLVVWEVIFMVLKILQYIKSSVDVLCLYKIASVVANLNLKFSETEHCARLRLNQMLLIFVLQDVVHDNVYPSSLKALEVFEPILRDYTIKTFFTKRHKHFEAFVIKTDNSMKDRCEQLKLFEQSIEKSIQMLKNKTNLHWGDIINEGHFVSSVLDILQSKELVDILVGGVIKNIPFYKANKEIKTHAIGLLLKLLNLTYKPLKIYVYIKLSDAFKKHIGCLMSGERYSLECSNSDLLKSNIIGVPLNTELFMHMLHDSVESSCDQIQNICCQIFELLLKSHNLFGTHWYSILSIVVLPLLNCCTFSESIIDLLLEMFNPDLRELPYICVLQGNISFLFHSNADKRSEALTRLIYMLNSLKGAEDYLPNLVEISDTLPNDICFHTTQREYLNIFSDRLPVRCDVIASLNNLLHILESTDVEPLIRKTTLMQINVLCNNWNITAELCGIGALYLILQALESALQKSSELDYADAAAPAIGVLNKVMLYDSSIRCELAQTQNIYVLLLRALLMFHHDIQVRQDVTMCLFQLLFSSQFISTENGIEGPLLLGNIKVPVNISFRPPLAIKIQQEQRNVSRTFASALEEIQYWRMVVASSYFGGLKNITQKSTTLLLQLDIKEDLKLTSQDVRLIRATQPSLSLLRLVKAASNATDHRSLIQACQFLKQQLIVPTLKCTFSISKDFCVELNNILRRYLQMTPGNEDDEKLYEHLLDVAHICLNIPLEPIALEIFKLLQKDPRHALITMLLQHEEVVLQIYNKITSLLRVLIDKQNHVFESHFNASDCSSFYSNLFDLIIERCLKLFEIRDLQRGRCLLSLLAVVSSCNFNTSDQLLFFYCCRFVQLSSALKSFTQTGSQWHRDCLLITLQLCDQMQNPMENFRLNASFVKYLSGLCGHNDLEVRTLAWSILNVTSKTTAIERTGTEQINSDISGIELLIKELSYLPGGFLACCLSTLLDIEEAISVRHLAGQLLAFLIRSYVEVDEIEKLLLQHNFMRFATEGLTQCVCILEVEIPPEMDLSTIKIVTCELVSCYSLICITISQRSPAFLNELCTKSFMFKLYEILKQPPPTSKHIGYLDMIGHVCRLYTLCNANNFEFLQRTIARDPVWLGCFCQILYQIVASSNKVYVTFNMMQLFLILCKDATALEELSIKMQDYSMDIVNLFQDALNIKNIKTCLQNCSLSVLSLLLVKSQPEVGGDLSIHILNLFDSPNISIKSMRCNELLEIDNKKNRNNNIKKEHHEFENVSGGKTETTKSSISEHLCISLIRLFTHMYPVKVCKFATPPNVNQQHVTETLALLLKQSRIAQETAENVKFQDTLVKIFNLFFDEFATTSCTTYVKRNGENKKMAVITNLHLLLKLLISWYSSPSMLITDSILTMEYSKIIIKIWPWLAHSNDLRITVLQVCSFLSERSLLVCKQFSTLNNCSFPHSVLQLVAQMMVGETLKIKAHSTDYSILISVGLRVVMNCCSCLEGRTVLNKIHVSDVFDNLYPFNPKASQLKLDIVIAWLEFWELFSRYDEGAQAHHLNALCSVVNKSSPGCFKRLISLRILRNMAFLNINRTTLITSTDFIFTVNEIISQPIKESVEEQFVICVALWKLITGGIKVVATIRSTKLAKNLRLLKESLTSTNDENDETVKFSCDLLNVLNIIFKIFNN